ncbi:MAG: hypothetical protein Q7S78_01290 [Candidatus Azambacteria bacterium]|nr:hypothetical protein [Candidatus Azambacteria bacterium]
MLVKINDKYQWTKHSIYKMRYYGLSQQRIKRIIRHPARIEEAIVSNMIAVMCPDKNKEIWAMYVLTKSNVKSQMSKVKVITAWRYPGKSSARNPIPQEILDEIKSIV